MLEIADSLWKLTVKTYLFVTRVEVMMNLWKPISGVCINNSKDSLINQSIAVYNHLYPVFMPFPEILLGLNNKQRNKKWFLELLPFICSFTTTRFHFFINKFFNFIYISLLIPLK